MTEENQKTISTRTILNLFENSRDILSGLSLVYSDHVESTANKTQPELPVTQLSLSRLSVSQERTCLLCDQTFSLREDQVLHYKSAWHLYNLRQKIVGRRAIVEAKFQQLEGEESPPTTSDSEEEEEQPRPLQRNHRHAKIFLMNQHQNVISLYQATVYGRNNVPQTIPELLYMVSCLPSQLLWAVILMGGGHFAAAIFNRGEVEVHKTFHRYTVRAKQGGGQRAKDNQSGLSQPKSAGASLRRKNEQALEKEIQELLQEWADRLSQCDRIFLRAAGHNQAVFYSGPTPIFKKGDPRIRTIPFSTKKPTFAETQRAHRLLASIEVHPEDDIPVPPKDNNTIEETLETPLRAVSEPISAETIVEDKAETIVEDKAETIVEDKVEAIVEDKAETIVEDKVETIAEDKAGTIVEDKAEAKKSETKGKKKPKKPKAKKDVESELIQACRTLDWNKAAEHVAGGSTTDLDSKDSSTGDTALHLAAQHGRGDLVHQLMEAGANPGVRNQKNQAPYDTACDKDTRNVFRRFMAQFPDKYDYSLAKIPPPLTEEQERLKSEKNAERNREKKKKQKLKKSEEEQCKAFLALADSEKVVQNLAHVEKRHKDLVRCVLCGQKLNGRAPFEYQNFAFCSMNCLRVHRFS